MSAGTPNDGSDGTAGDGSTGAPCEEDGEVTCLERFKALEAAKLEAQKAEATIALETVKAELAAEQAELAGDIAAEAADQAVRLELHKTFHTKVVEVAAGSVERSQAAAKFLETAAASLGGTYAALLALVFSASGRPLPLRGVWSAVFLGLAVSLAIGYLAFLKDGEPVGVYRPATSESITDLNRTRMFVDWTRAITGNRRNFLRAAVVAFAFGVAFIPAAFVSAPATTAPRPEPPEIPRSVPAVLADEVSALFAEQVADYRAALTAPDREEPKECRGWRNVHEACAWSTDAGVERSFRRLAVIAVALVLVIPLAFTLWEGGRRRTT